MKPPEQPKSLPKFKDNVDYWSLPREMAIDEALRNIATKVMLGDEDGAIMAAIDVLTRLEPRTAAQVAAVSAKLEPLPYPDSPWPYEVEPGGDPQWDYIIPADEMGVLQRRDLELNAKSMANSLLFIARASGKSPLEVYHDNIAARLRDQLQQQQPPPPQPEPEQPPPQDK